MAYITVQEANERLAGSKKAYSDWMSLTAKEKNQLINLAHEVIEDYDFVGNPVSPAQGSKFPRDWTSCLSMTNDPFDPLVKWHRRIPEPVRQAEAEVLCDLLETESYAELILMRGKVGVSVIDLDRQRITMEGSPFLHERAEKLLSPFLLLDYSLRVSG